MAKLTTSDLTNLQNETSAVTTINNNFAAVETALENTLSRDGTTPNEMESSLDMNSNNILNLPAPASDTEPVRVADLETYIDQINGTSSGLLPAMTAPDANKLLKVAGVGTAGLATVIVDSSSNLAPFSNDVGALGTTSLKWADLFLASGGVINWNNGNATITHSSGSLGFNVPILPSANDSAAIGNATTSWSDLFLASGGVINWNNGNATITHSSGLLTTNVPITITGKIRSSSYIELPEIASPSSPSANEGLIYVKDDGSGNTFPYFKDSAGTETPMARTAATQAEMEAATSTSVTVTPGRTQYHPGVAKAWAKVSGDGTTIHASHNVSGITDSGTGQLVITINTDFSSVHWAAVVSSELTATTYAVANARKVNIRNGSQTVTAVTIDCIDDTATTQLVKDPTSYFFAGFGDQ